MEKVEMLLNHPQKLGLHPDCSSLSVWLCSLCEQDKGNFVRWICTLSSSVDVVAEHVSKCHGRIVGRRSGGRANP